MQECVIFANSKLHLFKDQADQNLPPNTHITAGSVSYEKEEDYLDGTVTAVDDSTMTIKADEETEVTFDIINLKG